MSRRDLLPNALLTLLAALAVGCGGGSRGRDAGSREDATVDAGLDVDAGSTTMNAVPTEPGAHLATFQHDGLERRYAIEIPTGYDGSMATPVVFFFHGGGGSLEGVRGTGLREAVMEVGWILVSPEGLSHGQPDSEGHMWSAVHCCGVPWMRGVDDVGFVRALVEAFDEALAIDRRRVYATGFSNGALFVHRLASEASDVFAAVAPSAGTIGGSNPSSAPRVTITAPPAPVPILLMHGELDDRVTYGGGVNPLDRYDISFMESVAFWGDANGCDPTPDITPTSFGRTATYAGCDAGSEVIAHSYAGLDHSFPRTGNGAGDDGARRAVAFFARHPAM